MLWFIGSAHHNWARYDGWTEFWADTMLFTDPRDAERLRVSWLGDDPENNPLNGVVSVYEMTRTRYEELVGRGARIDRDSVV